MHNDLTQIMNVHSLAVILHLMGRRTWRKGDEYNNNKKQKPIAKSTSQETQMFTYTTNWRLHFHAKIPQINQLTSG